jgi:pimeloyl-ACP methyl ester carboxylesterase
MAYETASIAARGLKTRVLDAGEGPACVVLHGWGGCIESMSPVIECLRRDFRVIAFDLPGFGESDAPPGSWSTVDYSLFVADAVRAQGVQRAHFLGHSYGAKTALYLAATMPELVDKLVLTSSSGLRSAPSPKVRAKRLLSRLGRFAGRLGPMGESLKQALYRRIASSDYREAGEMRQVLVNVVNEDFGPLLPRVRCPTLLIWGDRDDAVPVAHARRMERDIPDAGLVLFEGAGHFPYLDEPARYCRVIRHFFGVHSRSAKR